MVEWRAGEAGDLVVDIYLTVATPTRNRGAIPLKCGGHSRIRRDTNEKEHKDRDRNTYTIRYLEW